MRVRDSPGAGLYGHVDGLVQRCAVSRDLASPESAAFNFTNTPRLWQPWGVFQTPQAGRIRDAEDVHEGRSVRVLRGRLARWDRGLRRMPGFHFFLSAQTGSPAATQAVLA